jgi:uncharacterized phiE125 gp8 family phage protein
MALEVGDQLPNLSLTVTDATGTLADGGSVVLVITLPDQTPVSPAVNHTALGKYSAAYTTVQTGQHIITWTVTGANAGVFTDSAYVESMMSMVSLDEIRTHLKITRRNDDEILRSLGIAASDLAESSEGTNRRWRRTSVTGELHTGGSDAIQLYRFPVISITTVVVDGTLLTTADYDLSPTTGLIYSTFGGFQYSGRRMGVSVSYVAGATAIPLGLRDAVLELIRHLYALHRGGTNLPRQDEPDYTTSLAYLVPNRVAMAFRAYSSSAVG